MHSPRRHSYRSLRRRPVAFGLSLLLLGLQLLGLGHLALERHGVCWEHGTLTELGTFPSSLAAIPRANSAGLHAGTASAVLDGDGHHHCSVQVSRRDWGAPPAGALWELRAGSQLSEVAVGTSGPRADETRLRWAPKQSPPHPA